MQPAPLDLRQAAGRFADGLCALLMILKRSALAM